MCSAACSGPCVCRAAPKAKTEPTSVAVKCNVVLLCYSVLFCVVLCFVVLCCVLLCCVGFCFVVLCSVVLCCAVLCCVVLCLVTKLDNLTQIVTKHKNSNCDNLKLIL